MSLSVQNLIYGIAAVVLVIVIFGIIINTGNLGTDRIKDLFGFEKACEKSNLIPSDYKVKLEQLIMNLEKATEKTKVRKEIYDMYNEYYGCFPDDVIPEEVMFKVGEAYKDYCVEENLYSINCMKVLNLFLMIYPASRRNKAIEKMRAEVMEKDIYFNSDKMIDIEKKKENEKWPSDIFFIYNDLKSRYPLVLLESRTKEAIASAIYEKEANIHYTLAMKDIDEPLAPADKRKIQLSRAKGEFERLEFNCQTLIKKYPGFLESNAGDGLTLKQRCNNQVIKAKDAIKEINCKDKAVDVILTKEYPQFVYHYSNIIYQLNKDEGLCTEEVRKATSDRTKSRAEIGEESFQNVMCNLAQNRIDNKDTYVKYLCYDLINCEPCKNINTLVSEET